MNTLLMSLMIMIMSHEMPKLPYANNALEPVISQQTIEETISPEVLNDIATWINSVK